jgi:uncharacterized protein YjaZ
MVKVILQSANNFTEQEKNKLAIAIHLLDKVLNSQEFKGRVLQTKFSCTNQNSQQIIDTIYSGKEIGTSADGNVDIYLNIYDGKSNVVGYTYPNTLKTWVSKYWFNSMTPAEISGNIAHEYSHKIGYDHPFWNWKGRSQSVPYQIGNIVAELAKELK